MCACAWQILFVISQPDVFKSGANTYVIFGDAKVEDPSMSAQAAAAQQFKAPEVAAAAPAPADAPAAAAAAPAAEDDTEEVDASGLEANDIQLVMTQANVSRARAVKALRNNDGDIVNAIMELTM